MQTSDMLTLALTRAIIDSVPPSDRAAVTTTLYSQLFQQSTPPTAIQETFGRVLTEARALSTLLLQVNAPPAPPAKVPPPKKKGRPTGAPKKPRAAAAAPAPPPPPRASRREDDDSAQAAGDSLNSHPAS